MWGKITEPMVGYVSMGYVLMDGVEPPVASEREIRINEVDKAIASLQARKSELG